MFISKNWRDIIRSVRKQAVRHPLDSDFLKLARDQSYVNMLSVFYKQRFAVLKALDPTGRQALRGARALRHALMRDFGSRGSAQHTASILAARAYGIVTHRGR